MKQAKALYRENSTHINIENGQSQLNTSTIKPILRWAGSKRKLIPLLLDNIPPNYSTYHEPFVGSAALFLALQPKRSILSDFNGELVEFYQTVKTRPWLVYEKASSIKVSKAKYYQIRKIDTNSIGKVDRAARFLYLNRYCFNGVYRTNMQNQFNVPMGTKTGDFPDIDSYKLFVEQIRSADIIPCDYLATTKNIRKNDFIYLDPPYTKHSDRNRGEYGNGCFNSNDLNSLCGFLSKVDKRGAFFCLSYTDDIALKNLLTNTWRVTTLKVRRSVASSSSKRSSVNEILVTNY